MASLASWFLGLFGSLVAWFLQYFTKKAAITAAAVSAFVSITIAFGTTINGLLAGIQYVSTSPYVVYAGLVIPSNAAYCGGAMVGAHLARWAYDAQIKVLNHWSRYC